MQKMNFLTELLKLKRGIFLMAFILTTSNLWADGTKQVSPVNGANGASLLVAPDIFAGPTLNCPIERRLQFTILDHNSENLYFGFQPRTYNTSSAGSQIRNDVYYRILNSAGTIVVGPTHLDTSGNGFIQNYNQAYNGPNIGGATPSGYNPLTFNPTDNGDYYIEFYASADGVNPNNTYYGRITFPFFDLTVSTPSNNQSIGRIWCKEWNLVTTNFTTLFNQDAASSFIGSFIAYSPDGFKLKVTYTAGYKPLAFKVAFNYYGVSNTGDFTVDRKSINSANLNPQIPSGYQVFLTEPDTLAFPDGTVGTSALNSKYIFGCNGNFYIPIFISQPGDVSLLLDINGIPGYQDSTSDIYLEKYGLASGSNIITWDGIDGLGQAVPDTAVIDLTTKLFQGRTNNPVFDAELNTNGLSVAAIVPATGNRKLYWDDTNLTPFGNCTNQVTQNVTSGGVDQSSLNQGIYGPTHAWDGDSASAVVPAPGSAYGSATATLTCDDYGNARTINTWFYASDVLSSTVTLSMPTCDNDDDGVEDAVDLDDDNDGIYDSIEFAGLPDPYGDENGDGIPNFIDPTETNFIDLDSNNVDDHYDMDGDGKIDQYDLDADGDGIPDNIEAQTTHGYIAPVGPINSQGVYTNYFGLGGLTPVNTDTTDNPDYKDLDSDNEGNDDTQEAGIALSGLDLDNDGLDNNVDSTPTTGNADENGIFDDTQEDNFPDSDYDVTTNGDVDWRDSIPYINQSPIVTPLTVIMPENSTIGVNVGAGVTDPENNPLTYTYGPFPAGITVDTNIGTGTIIITSGSPGTYYIPYTVCDSSTYFPTTLCDNDTITVIVIDTTGPINNAPIANTDLVSASYGVPVTVNPIANDFDVDGDSLTVTMTPTPGWSLDSVTGLITYTPAQGFAGIDSVQYTICDDGTPSLCNSAWIYVDVAYFENPNVAPIATPDIVTALEDSFVTIDVLLNDSDPNGNLIGMPLITVMPSHGQAIVIPGDSTILYIPNPDYYGPDTIYYLICDDGLPSLCDTGMIVINVLPLNDAPNTNDITVTSPMDVLVGINVAAGTSDPENNPLDYTYDLTNVPAGSVVDTNVGNGTFNVTPPTGYTGTFTIPFTVCDSSAYAVNVLCTSGVITINIVDTTDGINDGPIANTDLVNAVVGDTLLILYPLANDYDPNGDPLNISVLTPPSVPGATITFGPNGTIEYVPAPGFIGTDSIQYQICDTATIPMCDDAWIYITINPVVDSSNVAPVAVDDYATTAQDSSVTINVLGNDSDPNGNSLGNPTIIVMPSVSGATAIPNSDGTITYVPAPGYLGLDSLVYTVCDNGTPILCDTATVYILVYPPNEPPSAGNETISVTKWCTDSLFSTIDVTANNIDPNGDSLIVTATGPSTMGGTVTVDTLGNIVYTPIQNYVGLDTVIYTVCDVATPSECVTDTIFITVLPDNDCDGVDDLTDLDDDNDGIVDSVECATATGACDSDNDGIVDSFDLDSDNDGISDITEAGGGNLDLDNDGMIDDTTDVNNDGLADVADSSNGGTTLPNPDTDGDGIPNFQDLDADNDGIPDVVENGLEDANHDGIVDNFTDTNDNGWDDNSEGSTTVNSDADPIPDYIDLDSDQDGIPDVLEGGQDDINQDGLVDIFTDANNNGWADPAEGDTIYDWDNDGTPDYLDHDTDGDTVLDVIEGGFFDADGDGVIDNFTDPDGDGWDNSATGEVIPDTDSDGFHDFRDLDSDGDGLPDEIEYTHDCDGDGIDDFIDADQCSNSFSVPSGFTPNGDGINDAFVITGIELYPNNSIEIFNRWGNLVYSTSTYKNDWTGKSNSSMNVGGSDLPTGTYYFVFQTGADSPKEISGYIYMQR